MSLKLIYCRLLILQLVACVCFTVDCMCYIVHCLFYPQSVQSCKRLVACHRIPCSFTGHLQGRLPYCFVAHSVSFSWVTVQVTGRLLLISIQMYWSLAWSLEQSQGFAGEVLSWESQIQLHQATRASAWSLALFLMDVRVVA